MKQFPVNIYLCTQPKKLYVVVYVKVALHDDRTAAVEGPSYHVYTTPLLFLFQ